MQQHHTTAKSQHDNAGCDKATIKNGETFNNHINTTVFLL